jgi:hypothetical protein
MLVTVSEFPANGVTDNVSSVYASSGCLCATVIWARSKADNQRDREEGWRRHTMGQANSKRVGIVDYHSQSRCLAESGDRMSWASSTEPTPNDRTAVYEPGK